MNANNENIQRLMKGGYILLSQTLSIIGVKKTCWYEGIKRGKFPPPAPRFGRYALWRCADILKLIRRIERGEIEL